MMGIGNLLQWALDWSEVWAPLIPLAALLMRRGQPAFMKPVILYLALAFFMNLLGDYVADYKRYLPWWLQGNNPIYNIHSVVRFACFAYFFTAIEQPSFPTLKKVLPWLSLIFLVVNFTFFEDFFHYDHLSGNLLATEAYLLLIYCMQYYLAQLKDEVKVISSGADFWVVTGLGIYVVINFFVFLFYVPMITENPDLAEKMWNVHNIAYIIFCIFIAKAFYEPVRHQLAI